ncbi:tRNA (adenine(58)-N(1))-methyltransferase, mitochondrial [Heptranchias perlo]|uniref:tRNA (adenine(58)-N(1))-methyltransferase, mitochondrial n=1 Tax=Heptranchias perlo TaxID=212740 RepID=UPI003559AB80
MLFLLRPPCPLQVIRKAARCCNPRWDGPRSRSPGKGCNPWLLSQSPGAALAFGRRRLQSVGSTPPGPGDRDEGERDASDPDPDPGREVGVGQSYPGWSRSSSWPGGRGLLPRRRSLSPLERVSSLIPHGMLSREVVEELQEQKVNQELDGNNVPRCYKPASVSTAPSGSQATAGSGSHLPQEEEEEVVHGQEEPTSQLHSAAKEVPFKTGDVVLVEFRRRRNLEFQKMFNLVKGGKLNCKWGMVAHQEILGKLPGQVFRTSIGFQFVIRRPSLEEFVLLMKRGPAISYPKDISTMLMMMDVSSGDCVLESGSGSGAMTLFLSRTVGSSGKVYSFEVRQDHHCNAKRNYQRWRNAWEVAREKEWPNNVDFIIKDIVTAADDIQGKMFDAIALDMLSPQLALPVVYSHLKQGGVCAVYLANVTQVIDLLEGIRCSQLSLSCEKILEVIHRDWLIKPAVRKDGSMAPRVEPQRNGNDEVDDEEGSAAAKLEDEGEEEETKPFCTVPYIARPHHEQVSHTAFLVKLRKFKPAPPHSSPHNSETDS